MKKLSLLILFNLILISTILAVDGRAIRSNWDCMDASAMCISPDGSQDVLIEITLRFHANEVLNIPMYLYFEDSNGTTENIEIKPEALLANPSNQIVGYNQLGIAIYAPVVDLKYLFSGRALIGQQDDYEYLFELQTTSGLFPVDSYPDLMACIDARPGMTSYIIDDVAQVSEYGVKQVCDQSACPISSSPTPRRISSSSQQTVDRLQVYPNPVISRLTVEYNSLYSSFVQIEFLDIQGKIVHQVTESANKGQNQATVDFNEFPKGIYICRLITNEEVKSFKFIKE